MTAYALAIERLGFLLSSFLFLVAFMYLGRYRRHFVIWRRRRSAFSLPPSSSSRSPTFPSRAAHRRSIRSRRPSTPFSASIDRADLNMDVLQLLGQGFLNCLAPIHLAMLTLGIVIGLLIGVLPGLTLVMGVILALPFTYKMGVTASIVLLAAMYVSGTYGGAFTAILFRIPGEPIDVPMLWDGYQMARKGRSAKALGWTWSRLWPVGSFPHRHGRIAEPLAVFALNFSAPEYFAIVFFGLASVISLGSGSLVNAFISSCIGLLIASVGTDPIRHLSLLVRTSAAGDGIEYLVVMVGAYGFGEVLSRLERGFVAKRWVRSSIRDKAAVIKGDLRAIKRAAAALLDARHPDRHRAGRRRHDRLVPVVWRRGAIRQPAHQMGSGIEEGIVAPQAAATASVGGALVPLLALGVPGSGATAVILGAFTLHGVQPGPQVLLTSAPMVYTIFASLFVGIIMMCIIGFFAIRPLVKILEFPEAVVSAFVMIMCFVGALSIRNNVTDLWLMIGFGVLGYVLERLRFPIAPLVLGTILGPIAEKTS